MSQPEILPASDPQDEKVVSVLVGERYAIAADGSCSELGDFAFTYEPELYELDFPGPTKPMVLKKDIDAWGWKEGTDLVVQGSARVDTPAASLRVDLSCSGGASFNQSILVTGDRHVERAGTGLRLTAPEPFTEMPMRWDKAYGGTDEAAADELLDPDYKKLLEDQLDEEAMAAWSEFSYPRNPAGKGFLILESAADGLPWPNLEFPDDMLSLDRLTAPITHWGARPYPACWDFLPYHWFPRSTPIVNPVDTHDGKMPAREVDLGLVPAGLLDISNPAERPWLAFPRNGHPLLQKHRLLGTELLTVNAMGPDGSDLDVQLPSLRPTVHLRLNGAAEATLPPAVLDTAVVDAEAKVLTLVWRAVLSPAPWELPADWEIRTEARTDWGPIGS